MPGMAIGDAQHLLQAADRAIKQFAQWTSYQVVLFLSSPPCSTEGIHP